MFKPESFMLRGQVWKVEYVPDLKTDDGGTALGFADCTTRVISINTDQHPDSLYETLLHEVFHAYFYSTPIPGVNAKLEEALCQHFATYVSDLLASNEFPPRR